jgi:hypothetical protein
MTYWLVVLKINLIINNSKVIRLWQDEKKALLLLIS